MNNTFYKTIFPVVIDNNNYVDTKTISVSKEIPYREGLNQVEMHQVLILNNVMSATLFYSLVDIPNSAYNNQLTSAYSNTGIRAIVKKGEEELLNKLVLDGGSIKRQTTLNAVLLNIKYDYPVTFIVETIFNSGKLRALLDSFVRDQNEHPRYLLPRKGGSCVGLCDCCDDEPSEPPTNNVSLFEYMKVMLQYNNSDSGIKSFYKFKGDINEHTNNSGDFFFTRSFEIENENYQRIQIAINENIAADLSHYEEEYEIPCSRTHITGYLLNEDIDQFRDNSHGELVEEPSDPSEITEETMTNSNEYFEMVISDIGNIKNRIYNHHIFSDNTENSYDELGIIIELEKNEKKLILHFSIIGYFSNTGVIKENDNLRLKSKFCLGVILSK